MQDDQQDDETKQKDEYPETGNKGGRADYDEPIPAVREDQRGEDPETKDEA